MQTLSPPQQLPVYSLETEDGDRNFKVYNFEGTLPNQGELLIPHRKDHFLLVFIRHADTRQWIDMKPYQIKDNAVYFTGPDNIIVKEEFKQLWSAGIAFTNEFLSSQAPILSLLPLIQNPLNVHELLLQQDDVVFVEDMVARITAEYLRPGEWQQRMLGTYLSTLLTYLSRLYTEQHKEIDSSVEHLLLKNYQAKINEKFRELHEVGDYASLLNISAGHLSEVVKMQSGKPAIKHIHARLVLEARRLLFHTVNPLKEIAFELGFSDASYFNRFFKRETGVTPAGYRDSIREMYH